MWQGVLISSDGSAEKIAGPGCTGVAFALALLAHHRAIVALLSDARQLVQHLHPHQQVHQRRWCRGTMRQSMMHIMQMHQSQILLDASHIKRALGFMHHNILCIHAAVFQDILNQVKQKISKFNTKWTIIDHSSFFKWLIIQDQVLESVVLKIFHQFHFVSNGKFFICVSVKRFYEMGNIVRDAVSQIDNFFLAGL